MVSNSKNHAEATKETALETALSEAVESAYPVCDMCTNTDAWVRAKENQAAMWRGIVTARKMLSSDADVADEDKNESSATKQLIEKAAKAIYQRFGGSEDHPWVEGGNSDKQYLARKYATAALEATRAEKERAS